MIELGLARIGRLLEHTKTPWRSIHVAGTNGKGSICAYLSAMLHAANVRCGRFTSPHLIDRWDCITIDEQVVKESLFRGVEAKIKQRNATNGIGASEFELLTATAFDIFANEKVEVGVVEVGLGGRQDATNILQNAFVTIISKIGLDHQALLGNTVEEIAYQKAGIMRPGVPCVVDGTNESSVLKVLDLYAKEIGAGPVITVPNDGNRDHRMEAFLEQGDLEPHQEVNLQCAFEALRQACQQLGPGPDPADLLQATKTMSWQGRLERKSIETLSGRKEMILIDGAHNAQSAKVLGLFVDHKLRQSSKNVTWVLAASKGKNVEELLLPLIRPGDNVTALQFGPVHGMPWVQPTASEDLLEIAARKVELGKEFNAGSDVLGALRWSSEVAGGGPLVVAGSLYLVSDVLRLLRTTARYAK